MEETEQSMKTVKMAGGKGTRIASLFPDIPKALIPMTASNGESIPVLEWEICSMRDLGFREIVWIKDLKAQLFFQ